MITLIADIGGTNTRLAITGPDGNPERVQAFANDSLDDLDDAVAAYLDDTGTTPEAAVLAVAGPVQGRRIELTNRDWVLDLDRIERRFGFRWACAVNDFEAFAWALPGFGPGDLRPLGAALPSRRGPVAVLGPGTGLGVAALVPEQDGGWTSVASEAGHMSFGPAAPDEWPVFERIAATVEAVSAECVVSGAGLARLHAALHPGRPPFDAAAIDSAAEQGDPAARATVALFVRLLGRFAGDVALAFKSTGGVYVGGGVAQKLGDLIDGAAFRAAFEAHPAMRSVLAGIPTALVTAAEPGLAGCAAYAAHLARRNAVRDAAAITTDRVP
ncbi:glucokinase [Rhodoplanes sp. TEM]|uniref:Glucokinase n=1 Tax=Rhodoplanes tepidamans TaxID=200616 RepID=A0ABT5JIG2_RHOTP|nr:MULTISPECIES: glucokinase [Rhodoplanes]MDC7789386.1 glucokinase [Rhodoplanes tepidamans]MDC7984520.1 glucokinase [Rhodoplanes sp. TEM]MDQ0357929.1 glucokinase [Rhodoplanes tepidamans]